jgi:rsbT antagonist protein RsbS
MSELLLKYGIASYVSGDTLVVPFQTDFYTDVIEAFRQDILHRLHAMPELKGLIIDLSHVVLLDLGNMHVLEDTLKMACIYDVEAYLVGLKPEVALALVGLGYEGKVNTALTLGHAMQRIKNRTKTKNMQGMQYALMDDLEMIEDQDQDQDQDQENLVPQEVFEGDVDGD